MCGTIFWRQNTGEKDWEEGHADGKHSHDIPRLTFWRNARYDHKFDETPDCSKQLIFFRSWKAQVLISDAITGVRRKHFSSIAAALQQGAFVPLPLYLALRNLLKCDQLQSLGVQKKSSCSGCQRVKPEKLDFIIPTYATKTNFSYFADLNSGENRRGSGENLR